jgi:hypothetical protein
VASSRFHSTFPLTRRRFLTAGLASAAGLALYSGEIARHVIEISHPEIRLRNLPEAFDGFHIVQLSDIHLNEFTEPFFLREAVDHINRLRPDAVFLTGDFVTYELLPRKWSIPNAWKCASILEGLQCTQRYAVLGNHDVIVSAHAVTEALTASGIVVLRNAALPFSAIPLGFGCLDLTIPSKASPTRIGRFRPSSVSVPMSRSSSCVMRRISPTVYSITQRARLFS